MCHPRFILGSTDTHTVQVITSCCYAGISVQVKDLAGNTMVCEIGEVMASADKLGSEHLLLVMMILVIMFHHVW